jgi:hypothetical protein
MSEREEKRYFLVNQDVERYLSLTDPSRHSDLINLALQNLMMDAAVIDLGEGNDPVAYWSLLEREKAAVCRQLAGRYGEPRCDQELWSLVADSSKFDLWVISSKYLTLHRLRHARPFRMPPGWRATTGTKPRATTKTIRQSK